MESTFHAPDIECDGCANSIKKALGRVPGIQDIEVDVPIKTVTVQYDSPADAKTISSALDAAGFPSEIVAH